jgi:hypothetical protein
MTTVANDTSRTPLQATTILLSQPLAIATVTKLIFLLLLVGVEVDGLVVEVAAQVVIEHHLAQQVVAVQRNLKLPSLQKLMKLMLGRGALLLYFQVQTEITALHPLLILFQQ